MKTLKIFIGYDPKESVAFHVLSHSLLERSSKPISIIPINLGNLKLEKRIEMAKNIANGKVIIQADGYPMSGGQDDYNTTLQAVACADVINKKFNMRLNRKKDAKMGKAKISSKRT